MHATWHALQPMHFDSSISLAICGTCRTWGVGVVVAERATTSRLCKLAMVSSSCLLDVHQERLELRRLRVRIADERRERVGQVAVLGHPLEAPVDGYADGVHLLAVDIERTDALRDDTGRDHFAPV